MDFEVDISDRRAPFLPLQNRNVTFQSPQTESVDAGSEAGYDHLETINEEMYDEFHLTTDPEERRRKTLRRRTLRKEVAEFCHGPGTSDISFMGTLISLSVIKPEHHSVTEYMAKAGSANDALLKVFKEEDVFRFTEGHITAYIVEILRAGADVDVTDDSGDTALHLAAKRALSDCAKELLKWGANPNKDNKKTCTALEVALEIGLREDEQRVEKYSRFAAVVIQEMIPAKVRNIFVANPVRPCKISFHKMLKNSDMQSAVQAVLDATVEPLMGSTNIFKVYYSILESNDRGEPPGVARSARTKSAFDEIVSKDNKDIVTHSAVRLLMQSKWKRFARTTIIAHMVMFLITMSTMSIALVLGIDAEDPSQYHSTVDIIRGVLEGLTIFLITATLYTELCQIAVWRLRYLEYSFFYFNYMSIMTAISLYVMIPLRILNLRGQWVFASMAYLFYGLKAFKFLMAIRSVGIYVHVLFLMIRKDVLLFVIVFAESLFAFSGAFFIALHSEVVEVNVTTMIDNGTNGSEYATSATVTIPQSQINPLETGSYFNVFYTGIRILIQGESVIEDYAKSSNEGGLGVYGIIHYLIFLFFVVVVLLSLLIAQMSDTFATTQADADRIAILIRARTIISVERTGVLGMNFRKVFFIRDEIWKQPKKHLRDIKAPEIDIVSRRVCKLEKLCESHGDILEELRDSLAEQRKNVEAKLNQILQEVRRNPHQRSNNN